MLSYAKIVEGSSKRAITENSTDKVYYHKRFQLKDQSPFPIDKIMHLKERSKEFKFISNDLEKKND